MRDRILVAPAGWEERYEEGLYIDIEDFKPSKIVIPFSKEYSIRTIIVRNKIREKAQSLNIKYLEFEHDYWDAVSLYKSLLVVFEKYIFSAAKIRLNGTTAPRELIWFVLHFLSDKKIPTEFSYFRPLDYGSYLSRDAMAPRLVLKCSGIAYPDRPTCILALSGFDEERLAQLKQRYEPKKMLIGRQIGDQLGNKHRNVSANLDPDDNRSYFDFDCYDTSDNAVDILCKKIDELEEPYNVVAASLGPKPSAITIFKLTQKRPEVGLVYIPSRDYSEDYSIGIDLNKSTVVNIY